MAATSEPRGVVLVVVLLGLVLMMAAGLGLALSARLARLTVANYAEAVDLLNAAESALALTVSELRARDLDAVLGGAETSGFTDGPPGPRAWAPHATLDLTELTNRLTCGQAVACTDAQRHAISVERPWGANNPHWRLFLYGVLPPPPWAGRWSAAYVAVWIGDDPREDDDDPARDGADPDEDGRYIVRARAEAFGPRGGHRALEAELTSDTGVQSWRVVTARQP